MYPDGAVVYRVYNTRTGETDEVREGVAPGLFSILVTLADQSNAWILSSDSLNAELQALQRGRQGPMFVTDADHVFLEFRLKGKTLVADFYGSSWHSEHYEDAVLIKVFARIEEAFLEGVPVSLFGEVVQ